MSRTDTPLWTPDADAIAASQITALSAHLEAASGRTLGDYAALHALSVEEPALFWTAVWDLCDVVAETRGESVLEDADAMPGARFFPDAQLNFAENLMRRRDDGLSRGAGRP